MSMSVNVATKPWRPMLAETADFERANRLISERGYLLASYKLDGIRCIIINGGPKSRTLKPIPNQHVQRILSNPGLEGLDGELICGTPYGEGVFARAESAFMSQGGEPQFSYHVFDHIAQTGSFHERSNFVQRVVERQSAPLGGFLTRVSQFAISDITALMQLEKQAVEKGYEGLILRDPIGPYKQGRSTLAQGWMLKLKRFSDSEAVIIGFEELMHNANEARLDERGFTKRSSEQAGKIPAGMLGALQVRDAVHGWEFNIGSGFDHDLRQRIWRARDVFLGKVVKYKYLSVGMQDVPRHPIFLGFRTPGT